jgi:hypothetical protein
MAFRIAFDPGDPGRPDIQLGRSAGSQAGFEHRIVREGLEVIAHGALICPACDLPLATATALPAGSPLECGFCGHTARSREFLACDVYDTLGNEAQLVARIV